ncbi:KAP family P-loop NTPase fold protein [Gardnerella vaginalis]|uniref:p-loop domain protein, KAP family n=1 Tax=Gardnerella vaginalis TaxID=2702 RepID=A0A133NLX5_GARVA|nr:P-loop NTPase fold protein [Gardnerella vaginalis]KXA17282.1 P-loop domain protein, KAP family [Gardnerella vaginalis]
MSYVADKPIEKADEDLLGRFDFAKQFGKSICEYDSKDGLVIGLYGKWGSGKTSIINMAISEIPVDKSEKKKWYSKVYKRIKKIFTSQKTEEDQNHNPIIIRFSPWNYSDKNNLISLFFYELKNKLGVAKGEENKEKIGKAISQYSDIIDALSSIPVAGPAIAPILKTAFKAAVSKLMKTPSLDEAKEKLCKALEDFNHKIIVFIDDIDRLTTPQIKDIFQLVKQVGDFPNIIYVLTMDRKIVCNALSEYHNIDGDEYLKKIVQVSFEIPEIDKSLLPEILKGRFSKIIHKNDCEEEFENNEYFETVLKNCVNPYIKNIRDINRLFNAFQFKYGALRKETSFVDLLAITAIEIFEPKLYKWIFNNRNFICRGEINSSLRRSSDPSEYIEKRNQEFENLGLHNKIAFDIVSTLFPTFAEDINEHKFANPQSEEELISKMRVGSIEKFDLYFSFNLSSIKIPREEIIKCVNSYSKLRLFQKIRKFNKDGNILYFLENVESLFKDNKISNNRLALIASALFELQYDFKGIDSSNLLETFACNYSETLLYNIIAQLENENDRYEIISSAVQNINKYNIGTTSTIIKYIRFDYKKYVSEDEHKNFQFISLKHLEDIEKIYATKIKSISYSEDILSSYQFDTAFYIWRCIDEENAISYVKNLFNNETNKLKFLCITTYNNLTNWKFYSENCFNLVSEEEFYDSIKKFDKSRLDEFTKEEQIKLASFVLNYKNNNGDFDHVSEREALQLIKKWKSESKSN